MLGTVLEDYVFQPFLDTYVLISMSILLNFINSHYIEVALYSYNSVMVAVTLLDKKTTVCGTTGAKMVST
jgi:hypothetical protein